MAVRNLDLRATKMLIHDERFQQDVHWATFAVRDKLAIVLKDRFTFSQAPYRGDFYRLAECAVRFKLELISCPMEYRLIFCPLAIEYDQVWMSAEDLEGTALTDAACPSRKVRLCLFPAIIRLPSETSSLDPDDITTSFVCNRRFFDATDYGRPLEPASIVSKAVVMNDCVAWN
jgi:hypothetical protein